MPNAEPYHQVGAQETEEPNMAADNIGQREYDPAHAQQRALYQNDEQETEEPDWPVKRCKSKGTRGTAASGGPSAPKSAAADSYQATSETVGTEGDT